MVIDDLNVVRIAITPPKANPPLIVDPDAVLPLSVTGQRLQPIARWGFQVAKAARAMNLGQLSVGGPHDVVWNALEKPTFPRRFRGIVPKRLDH